jgi:hypothetical protein
MNISIMCKSPSPPVVSSESQRVCSHTFHDKGVHHLSLDRHVSLCGIDCGTFVFITRVDASEFVPNAGICTKCVNKLTEIRS